MMTTKREPRGGVAGEMVRQAVEEMARANPPRTALETFGVTFLKALGIYLVCNLFLSGLKEVRGIGWLFDFENMDREILFGVVPVVFLVTLYLTRAK